MNDRCEEFVKRFKKYCTDYGKFSIVVFLIILCGISLVVFVTHLAPKKLQVTFLDIGQGDSILIQTPSGHDMLIDGGTNNHVLEKLTEKLGYFDRHIDILVATHPDSDHITGLIPVLQKYDVKHIITSTLEGHTGVSLVLRKTIDDEHAHVHVGKEGDEIFFGDGVTAHILYPSPSYVGDEKDTNSASVSMVITYGDESILLTGDLPSTYEGELLSEELPRHITIYKAGHHGSKYSSGEQLLTYIRPEYAVISAGKDNKYGHPNPEALGRLQIYSKEILSTIDRGSISFLLDGKTVKVTTDK